MAYYTNPYSMYPNSPNAYSTVPNIPQQNQGNIVWVQGRAGAEAYPVAPGNRLMLMDSNEPVVYVKQADMSGRMLPLMIYDLVERVETSNTPQITQAAESVDYDRIRQIISEEVSKRMTHTANKKEGK